MNKRWKIAQAVEIKWWEFYLKNKDSKDYLEKKRQYWNRVLKTLDFSLKHGDQVLDAGCGPAGIFLILKNQQVDALDPLISKYEAKIAHFDQSNYPWVTFYDKALEQFQPNKAYDQVFCLNVINHVANLPLSLDILLRATKPGGDLLLTVDAHNYTFFKKIFQAIPGDILHPHQYSLHDYKRLLQSHPCSIYKTQRMKKGHLFDYWAIWIKKNRLQF